MPRRRVLILTACSALTVVAALVLFLFYRDELRLRVVEPALRAYVMARYYLEFVPQVVLWMLPFAVIAALFLRWAFRKSMRRPPARDAASSTEPIHLEEGELARLARQLQRASHSRFARVRVSRSLVEIASRLIAAQEGVSVEQARRLLAEGYCRESPAVHAFLIPRRHYTSTQSGEAFARGLQATLTFLEAFDRHG